MQIKIAGDSDMKVSESDQKDVFLEAIKLSRPEERLAYVRGACAGNPDLLQRVEKLLAAHDRSQGPLDSPAKGMLLQATLDQPTVEKLGSQIGPFKLLQEIGKGGMGVVYMAEQSEPVSRRVALKIIKPGMDSKDRSSPVSKPSGKPWR